MKAALPLLLLVSACTVGPDFKTPQMTLAARFADGGGTPAGDVALQRWWTALHDPILDALADRGLAQNLGIQTAMERINQAEAALRATGTVALVNGDLEGNVRRSQAASGIIDTQSSGTAAGTFVIDLFGGEARTRQQAQADLEASTLDVGTARLAFLSSLVGSYIDARYYQAARAVTLSLIDSRQQTLGLVQRQRDAGLATDLDVLQSQALLEETRATLPVFEQGFHAAVYAIATLLAEPAQPILAAMQRGAAQPAAPRGDEAGLPAELLRNRPDVRAAEQTYAAAVAGVGIAEAQLYPSLTLVGTVTTSSQPTWGFGPAFVIPVLDQPVLRANRDQAISVAKQAELKWRSTVLQAVQEVQTAQGATIRGRRTVSAQQAATTTYARARELSRTTYEAGTTTFLDLLDAERSAGQTQLALALATRNLANNWVSLQIAAGRGWATAAPSVAPSP